MHEGWWKWGEPSKRKQLDEYPEFKYVLQKQWGTNLNDKINPINPSIIENETGSKFCLATFTKVLPSVEILCDKAKRLLKSRGKSYTDLIRAVTGDAITVVDAVIFPHSHQQVLDILKVASEHEINVYPFGGGTNVVGAFESSSLTNRPRIAIDLSKMKRLIKIDEENSTADFEAGIFGPSLEKILNEKGFTLGHFPQSFEFSTLGGWIATHSAGQQSSTYGRIEDVTISMKVATPAGTIVAGEYEADAQGINIKSLFFGSEGTLGIVTEVTLKIYKIPACKIWTSFLFKDYNTGLLALKKLIQIDVFPAIIRYSDENETFFLSLLNKSKSKGLSKIKSTIYKKILGWKKLTKPCMMILRIDGTASDCQNQIVSINKHLNKNGGFYVGALPGKKWESNRFGIPYLQDDMIERNIFIDTVETVLPWNMIDNIRKAVYDALHSCSAFNFEKGIIISHVSHVYQTAASIYFTLITTQDTANRYRQWQAIKDTVMEVTQKSNCAVSHHHSIGTDLQKWYLGKIDALTKKMLLALKATIDPNRILNPGKLFDEQKGNN